MGSNIKNKIGLLATGLLLIAAAAGCSNNNSNQLKENFIVMDNGVYVNTIFNEELMKTIDGSDYQQENNNFTYVEKELDVGFGITFTGELAKLREENKLFVDSKYPYSMLITYISDAGRKEISEKFSTKNQLSEADVEEIRSIMQKQGINIVGVFRQPSNSAEADVELKTFQNIYKNLEEIVEHESSKYYFGYNTDYSYMTLSSEEKSMIEKLTLELTEFKNQIAIYPARPMVKEENKNEFEGKNLLDIDTTAVDGETVSGDLFKNYDLTMVNIWATWCGPCTEEMPELAKLHKQLPDNVNLITVCTDANDEPELTKEILSKSNAEFQSLVMSDTLNEALIKDITAFPTTVFVNKDGIIVGESIIGVPSMVKGGVVEGYMTVINNTLAAIQK